VDMAVDVGQLVGGAFGGALVSSVLTPAISQRRERRDTRADVLRAIGEIERARWAPTADRETFRAAIVSLRAAALVAAADRDVVESYALLAQYGRRMSEASWEAHHDEEVGGYISLNLAQLTTQSARVLTDSIWHPYRKRRNVRRRLTELHLDEERLRDEEPDIPWHIPMF
jgi:hypothetical protein